MKNASESNEKDEASQYLQLAKTVREHQLRTTLLVIASIVIHFAFSTWGFCIYFLTDGACERPLKSVVLACAIIFAVAGALTFGVFFLIRRLFLSVLAHEPTTKGTETSNGSAESSQPSVLYHRLPNVEVHEATEHGKRIEVSRSEELTRPVTDSITFLYCSFACLICAFITFAVYFFVALTWLLVENNNCRTVAPDVYLQARSYLIGLMIVFFLHALWYGLACRYCTILCDVYNIQQRFATWSSSNAPPAVRPSSDSNLKPDNPAGKRK